ncbi:hypothetical protein ABZW49_34950 [Nonomuraea wenchangensis]
MILSLQVRQIRWKFSRNYSEADTLKTVPEGLALVRRKDAESTVTRLKQETDGTFRRYVRT